jgi:hypothetical protein
MNVSQPAAAAAEALDRPGKLAELDAYPADLEAELGPIPADEQAAAAAWVDRAFASGGAGTTSAGGRSS